MGVRLPTGSPSLSSGETDCVRRVTFSKLQFELRAGISCDVDYIGEGTGGIVRIE
jgi:hypothetical protein